MIDAVVAPVLHNKLPVNPLAVNTELPQLSVTSTAGASGITFGDAVPLPAALVQPSIVCVTVYTPPVVTVMDALVSPVLHNKLPVNPLAVNTELPQLSVTPTAGAAGITFGDAVPLPSALVQPSMVCVTV